MVKDWINNGLSEHYHYCISEVFTVNYTKSSYVYAL